MSIVNVGKLLCELLWCHTVDFAAIKGTNMILLLAIDILLCFEVEKSNQHCKVDSKAYRL